MKAYNCFLFTFLLFSIIACQENKKPKVAEVHHKEKAHQKKDATVIKTDIDEYYKYEAKHRGYTINIPTDWDVAESKKSGSLSALGPANGGVDNVFRESLMLMPKKAAVKFNKTTKEMEPQPVNLAQELEGYLGGLKNTQEGFLIRTRDETYINKIKTKRVVYESKRTLGNRSINLKSIVFVLPHEYEAYIINMTERKEVFDETRPIFEEIARSIVFE